MLYFDVLYFDGKFRFGVRKQEYFTCTAWITRITLPVLVAQYTVFLVKQESRKTMWYPSIRKALRLKSQFIFHAFERKFNAAITLLGTPQGRKKNQPRQRQKFLYVVSNYICSRQSPFLLLWEKTTTTHTKLEVFLIRKITSQSSRTLPHALLSLR